MAKCVAIYSTIYVYDFAINRNINEPKLHSRGGRVVKTTV